MLSQDTLNRHRTSTASTLLGIDGELERYKSETNNDADCKCDNGIQYWISREKSYPLLAPIALDLISAPASEAYVERVFLCVGIYVQENETV
jgi:hypothetical protein